MSRGRGRGRGRGRSLGNLEALGIAPGEPPPQPILQPPPLFPPLDQKPLELSKTDASEYLLSVKQEFRQSMKQSPFYLRAGSDKKVIERYSDKYQEVKGSEIDNFLDWTPHWSFFPDELQIGVRKKRKRPPNFKPTVPSKRPRREQEATETDIKSGRKRHLSLDSSSEEITDDLPKEISDDLPKSKHKRQTAASSLLITSGKADKSQLSVRFEQLEKTEQVEKKAESENEEEVAEEEEYYDEEFEEEGTDYNLTYFDNGEEFGAEDDDGLEDGPYY